MPTFFADELGKIGVRIFMAAGVPETTAVEVVESLVLSNLVGVDSHGVVRIPQYIEAIKAGEIVPDAEPEIIRDSTVVTLMQGKWAFGQVVARRAMLLAISKAQLHGLGAISFTNVHHIGRLGEWAELAAGEGLIGLVMANGSRPGGLVAPFGARQAVTGTNPIAFAIPAGSYSALVGDFSTGAVAEGKVRIAFNKGERIPLGWVIDGDGHPTTNPADLYDGGALLTFGGHKGYALCLLVEVLGGLLSGAGTPIAPDYKELQNGVFMLVIDPGFFRPVSEYREGVDLLFTAIKEALPAEGMEGALIPGEPEQRRRAERENRGIPIDPKTWADIQEVARVLNVKI